MNTTRLAALRAKPISWVTTIIVMPWLARVTITSSTSLTISGSSAEVGSSNRMTFGSMASARAMATRCCCPPDSWAGYFSAWDSTPTRFSRSMPRWRASAGFRRTGPRVTFSSTVLCANRLNDWNTMPTSPRRWASALPSSGSAWPSMVMVPDSIGSSRLMARHSVDLPDPEGPRTTTTSPLRTLRLMSLRTCSSPKCFCTSVSTTRDRRADPGPPTDRWSGPDAPARRRPVRSPPPGGCFGHGAEVRPRGPQSVNTGC